MAQWIGEGKLKRKFHIVEGLEQTPQHLNLLFTGGNTGKLYDLPLFALWMRVIYWHIFHRVVKVSKGVKAKL